MGARPGAHVLARGVGFGHPGVHGLRGRSDRTNRALGRIAGCRGGGARPTGDGPVHRGWSARPEASLRGHHGMGTSSWWGRVWRWGPCRCPGPRHGDRVRLLTGTATLIRFGVDAGRWWGPVRSMCRSVPGESAARTGSLRLQDGSARGVFSVSGETWGLRHLAEGPWRRCRRVLRRGGLPMDERVGRPYGVGPVVRSTCARARRPRR